MPVMYRNPVYLEAAERTQDLLNIKWALRSAGHAIVSKWHDGDAGAFRGASKNHWTPNDFDRLQKCDMLVVLSGQTCEGTAAIAMMAGFALAHGIKVCWIGGRVSSVNKFPGIQMFDTADEFRTRIVQAASEPSPTAERLVA